VAQAATRHKDKSASKKVFAYELAKSKRAASTAATFSALSSALSVGAAIAMAQASAGEDLSKYTATGKAPTTLDDTKAAISRMEAETGKTVSELTIQRKTLVEQNHGWELSIEKIGVKFDMGPQGARTVLNPSASPP
jgi:hypothetical protein